MSSDRCANTILVTHVGSTKDLSIVFFNVAVELPLKLKTLHFSSWRAQFNDPLNFCMSCSTILTVPNSLYPKSLFRTMKKFQIQHTHFGFAKIKSFFLHQKGAKLV